MSRKEHSFSDTKFLTECAVMLAIAAVLSEIRIIHLPRGGSVTLASMLPIIIIAYRYGVTKGLLAGIAYGAIQQLLGLKNLSGMNWYSVIAIIGIDYLLAYVVCAFGGLFRGKLQNQRVELLCGAIVAGILRFCCHFLSGITVWNGWGVVGKAGVISSLSYNGTYMLPEIIILALVAWYLGGVLDFTQDQLVRVKQPEKKIPPYAAIGVLIIVAGIIADTVLIFNNVSYDKADMSWFIADNGVEIKGEEYTMEWTKLIIISAICLISGVGLILYSKKAGNAEIK